MTLGIHCPNLMLSFKQKNVIFQASRGDTSHFRDIMKQHIVLYATYIIKSPLYDPQQNNRSDYLYNWGKGATQCF